MPNKKPAPLYISFFVSHFSEKRMNNKTSLKLDQKGQVQSVVMVLTVALVALIGIVIFTTVQFAAGLGGNALLNTARDFALPTIVLVTAAVGLIALFGALRGGQ